MPATTSDDLLKLFDECPLNTRYWASIGLISDGAALDIFDF
jgi:hypothetical protein